MGTRQRGNGGRGAVLTADEVNAATARMWAANANYEVEFRRPGTRINAITNQEVDE